MPPQRYLEPMNMLSTQTWSLNGEIHALGWGMIPWRRAWQPTPVFLSDESHGQRSLAGYSPWGCKESDTNEHPRREC